MICVIADNQICRAFSWIFVKVFAPSLNLWGKDHTRWWLFDWDHSPHCLAPQSSSSLDLQVTFDQHWRQCLDHNRPLASWSFAPTFGSNKNTIWWEGGWERWWILQFWHSQKLITAMCVFALPRILGWNIRMRNILCIFSTIFRVWYTHRGGVVLWSPRPGSRSLLPTFLTPAAHPPTVSTLTSSSSSSSPPPSSPPPSWSYNRQHSHTIIIIIRVVEFNLHWTCCDGILSGRTNGHKDNSFLDFGLVAVNFWVESDLGPTNH